MYLITNQEMRELEEVRKGIHNYTDGDVKKFWLFESLTGKLFRIVYKRRNLKWFFKNLFGGN